MGDKIPSHVAIIMDGNGRWAEKRNLPRTAGHLKGVTSFESIIEHARRLGIAYLTVFVFSTENWKRPASEVSYLLHLLSSNLNKKISKLHSNNIKLNFIGELKRLGKRLQFNIKKSIDLTKNNNSMVLTIALDYGGRIDILTAVKNICNAYKNNLFNHNEITEQLFMQYLMTKDLPDPDLLIRSGGEKRISNFMLWQLAYTELYFSEVAWPDFDTNEFDKALKIYSTIERRFGNIKCLEENYA